MTQFKLEIVTPEHVFFSGDVESIVFTTPQGEIGVLGGHMHLVVLVSQGTARATKGGALLKACLSPGFAEIKQDRTVILSESAEWC